MIFGTICGVGTPKQIDYPGMNNYSQFSYDGLWRNTKIVETTSGSVTSTKQFVVAAGFKSEERDAGSSVTKRFHERGQAISGTSYFYAKPHLDSVTELTDGSGVVQAQYTFDPFGRSTKLQGSLDADFQYSGYYFHQRSGLSLTVFRAYNAHMGRWIRRDLVGESAGPNLFAYVGNEPISRRDQLGLFATSAAGMTNASSSAGSFASATGKILCKCTAECEFQKEFQDVPGNAPFDFGYCMDNCIRRETTKVPDIKPGDKPMPGAPAPEGPRPSTPPAGEGGS